MIFNIMPKERRWLALILVIALIYPLHHALFYLFPPQGYVFNGGHGDEGTALALMKSVEWQYRDPWSLEGKTFFSNPTIPSAFVLIPLGFIAFSLKIDYAVFLIFLKFLFSFAYLLVLYHLTKHFVKNKKEFNIAFLILTLTSGIGALLQIPTAVATNNFTFAGISPSSYGLSIDDSGFTILSQFQHLYRLIALFAGYAAFYLFISGRRFFSLLLLGLSILAHPFFGSVFIFLILVYSAVHKTVNNFFPIMSISFAFFIPWLIIYLSDPSSFLAVDREEAFLPTLLISGGLPLLFAFYFVQKRIPRNANLALIVFSALLSVAQLSVLNLSYAKLQLTTPVYLLLQIPFFAVIGFILFLLAKETKDKNNLFLSLMLLTMLALSVTPSKFLPWFPFRFLHFLWLPIAVLSAKGILLFSDDFRINWKKLFLIIFILSFLSIIVFNLNFQLHTRDIKYPDFFHEDEINALYFLKSQQQGIVLSSGKTGSYLPYYTDKSALLGGTIKGEDERKSDYEKFFSAQTIDDERKNILRKYNISYVFYGYNEQSDGKVDVDARNYLEKIYDSGVKVFAVRLP